MIPRDPVHRSSLSRAAAALISVVLLTVVAAAAWPRPGESVPPGPSAQAPPAPDKPGVEIVPTALLVRDGAAVKRIVHLVIELPGSEAIQAGLTAALGGRSVEAAPAAFTLQPGRNVIAVRLPEPAKPVRADFGISSTSGGRSFRLARQIVLNPARPWTVYLFHHSHTDIGYTELQSRVARNHVEYLDSVIKYCRETDAYPDEAKFRWNIEVTWALENFVKTRPEADVKALVDLIKSGRGELSALYLQLSDC